jgi:uncharacterized repeat protein (TIGR02543 family)
MKQSIKILLSVILIACITISYALSPVIAANYTDTKSHWAQDKINRWSDLGIVNGSNNKFRPNDYITRGEIAIILNKIMKYQKKSENSFIDLDEKYYTDAILKANSAGVMSGNNKKIRPTDKATREEVAVMFVKALSIKTNENKDYLKFKDSSQISNWALESVNAMVGNGYVKGDTKTKFNPKSKITRGEVIAIIDNCIQALYAKEGTYSENNINGNVVINTPNVTLKDMQINGNIIIAPGVGEGSIHLDNVKVSGDIFVKGGGNVYFNNVSLLGSLLVNKVDGQIRIISSGATTIERALLESGATIDTTDQVSGGINSVEISAKVPTGQNIFLQGAFKLVKNDAINICIEAVGIIENLILNQKTIVKGGANIKSITTAKGADSVINGIFVAGGQTNISLGNQTTGSGNTVTQTTGDKNYIVTFQSNGGTVTAPLTVLNGSKLTLPPAPIYSGYVFMGWFTDSELTNEYKISTTVCSKITLYAKWNGWQKPTIIDERFETGYPKFSVTADKKIKLVIKLKEASNDNPIDVFMLVNQMNSLFDATPEEVIHGHCAAADGLVEVDEAPFIKVCDTKEHEIETQVSVKGNSNIKMYFVLKDKTGTNSQEPVIIEFLGTDISEKDTSAPELYNNGVYINKAKNKITLYFDEALSEASIPTAGAISLFTGTSPAAITLSDGTTTSAISVNSISLKNLASNKGVLELSVSGINDSSNLTIGYTKPEEGLALQDNAAVPNKVESFALKPVKAINYNISPDNVAVSNQGQYIYIKMDFALQDYNSFDFTINKGPDNQHLTPVNTDSSVLRIWSTSGDYHKMYICLDNIPSLSAGDKYYITLTPDPRAGTTATDFCGDAVSSQINIEVAPSTTPEQSVVPESISYNPNLNAIAVKLPYVNDLYSDGGMSGCLFTLNIDGASYTLRGKLYYSNGEILISQKNVPIDLTTVNWSKVSLCYSASIHNYFDSDTQMVYKSGMPFSGFMNIPITVSP